MSEEAMSGSLGTVTPEHKKELERFIQNAREELQRADDIKASLKEFAKTTGEKIGLKPALLLRAANVAFKNKLADDKEAMDTVEEILMLTGNA